MRSLEPGTRVLIKEGTAMVLGRVRDTAPHAHHALQISIAPARPLEIVVAGVSYSTAMILVGPDVRHRLSSDEGLILMLFEPESTTGRMLARRVGGRDCVPVELSRVARGRFAACLGEGVSSMDAVMADVLSLLGVRHEEDGRREAARNDPRIVRALSAIEGAEGRRIALSRIAREACLSESRLEHLFLQAMGIPIRRYLLWKRIVDAVRRREGDMTWISHQTGFSDLAHMSRTFKAMFGIAPREIFKNSSSVQVMRE